MVLPGVAVATPAELVRTVAGVLAQATRTEPLWVEGAFTDALHREGFSIGQGVAIPHTENKALTETVVCLVTLKEPLKLKTIDGRPPDVFFFILSKPDPHHHLLLLAHLARLAQSRTLVAGLREARSPEEMVKLVSAAEQRHRSNPGSIGALPSGSHALVVVSVGGEKLVDALLVDLVDQGFGDACVLEAQGLREAAAREVPLFAGFRDLFGDPGGRRVLILEVPADGSDAIIETVKRICEEHRAKDAWVSVVPIQTRWVFSRAAEDDGRGGH